MPNRQRNGYLALASPSSALALLLLTAGCGSDDATPGAGEGAETGAARSRLPDSPERPSTEATLRRERVTVLFAEEKYDAALTELQPLLDAEAPAARDLVIAAQIALRQGDWNAATTRVDGALAADSSNAGALYTKARIEMLNYELDAAIAGFERVLERAPGDPAAKLGIAYACFLRWQDDEEEADIVRCRGLLEEVIELGLPNGVQWYVTAVYQRSQIALQTDEPAEVAQDWQGLWDSLSETGYKASTETNLDQGDLAQVGAPEPFGTFPDRVPVLPPFGEPRVVAKLPSGTDAVWLHDVDGDRTPDLLTRAGGAVAVHLRDRKTGALTSFQLTDSGATGSVQALDLNQGRGGDTLDVLIVAGDALRIVEQSDEAEGERWAASPVALPTFGGPIGDVVPVDFDHEGDLDLFVVGEFGARLLRNDGAGAAVDSEGNALDRGVWTDATEAASLPLTPQTWCLTEDFDGDNDVDLMCAGPDGVHLMDSQRRGLFVDRGVEAFAGAAMPREPVVCDFDGNGRPDFFVPGADGSTLYLQTYDDWNFHRIALPGAKVADGCEARADDIDFDGAFDVVWATPDGGIAGLLAVGLTASKTFSLPALPGQGSGTARGLAVLDVDSPDPYGELALELCRVAGDELVAISPSGGLGNAVYLKFVGVKDNRQGVGAIVEVRSRDVYERKYWRGDAELFGLGAQKFADVVRVTWPNGVIQQILDVEGGVAILLDDPGFGVQPEGLPGSCPFLYTWNGETFEFISDVIGITPLGLPMAPGVLVPPDHDEYVLVRGDQLVPDGNNELVLQFTEELREVTYLDRVRLDVIDHPAGTAVYPNERFTFPPFPEAHTHVVERVAKAKRVTGSDGANWTDELERVDMRHPAPFTRLGGQFLGLAEPHWLELEFDPADFEGATKLRLIANGWFYWSDASVNMAAAYTPGVAFVPPTIEVPDGEGGWRAAGPPIGFPAGKSKTMVLDITQMIDPADPRMRLSSTLELYWDCIEIAVCNDDAEVWTQSLEAAGAELWARGFSAPIQTDRVDLPQFFDWDLVAPRPRWNQHPGKYTRFGEVSPLLDAIDDRYVILGSGDALTIRFDAAALKPVPEGYVRDYLIFLDGWAKDRDPNTHEALNVEPLPFHGMSSYPYGNDESFPDDEEHGRWREEWNTREGHEWIVPLSGKAAEVWLARERGKLRR